MHSVSDEQPIGFSKMFGNDLAMKEYFDSFPINARKRVSSHRFELGSVEETKNYSKEEFKKS